jgi:hypothetical protein
LVVTLHCRSSDEYHCEAVPTDAKASIVLWFGWGLVSDENHCRVKGDEEKMKKNK